MEQIEFVVVALMVLINAIFAGYEIALASVSVAKLKGLVEQHRPGAIAALSMKQGIEKSLAVVQLGITLVGLIAGATGGASAVDDISPQLQAWGVGAIAANVLAICIVVVPLTIVTIVVGELIPKLFALRNQEWVCLTLSPTMRFFALVTWPIVGLLEYLASQSMSLLERLWRPKQIEGSGEATELQELRTIASMARASRLIGIREESIILGAARMARRPLAEIVLPAEHIRMLRLDGTLSESLLIAHMDLHTRFPVATIEGDPQSIVGYVTFKDIVTALKLNPRDPSIRGILRSIPSLDFDSPISEALEFLLREHTHIAIVRDQSQAVRGMITLEDIVEELLGDIQDEHDLLPVHVIRVGGGWIVGGGASIERIRELTSVQLPVKVAARNLNSWVIERLGRVPTTSDLVIESGVSVQIRKVRRQRVLEANLRTVR